MLKSEEQQPTTTEELIVQYLDGELVRKELETMLFERLAQSSEARGLLREYLTLRGAIRVSYDDAQFQLSGDLDARTRARIEQVLGSITIHESTAATAAYAADAKPIATEPLTRSLKRWTLRPSVAALALLLAIGGTWFVTRQSAPQMAANTVTPATETHSTPAQPATQSSQVILGTNAPATQATSAPSRSSAPRAALSVARNTAAPSQDFAQASQAPAPQPSATQPTAAQETQDPADIMLSHRYAKMLNASSTEKREVVISSRDRL